MSFREEKYSSSEEEDYLNIHTQPLGEDEYVENATARFNREHKHGNSSIEKLPKAILEKIAEFLYNKEKFATVVSSPTLRKAIRPTPVDLSAFPLGVEDLALFLNGNKDLTVVGLMIDTDQSEGTLKPLKKYLGKLKKLTIGGDKSLDLSHLSLCIKLKYLKIDGVTGAIPHLDKCLNLRTLMLVGDSDINFNLPELTELEVVSPSDIRVDVRKCPKLVKMYLGEGILRKLKVGDSLSSLVLDNVELEDYSTIKGVSKIVDLEININDGELDPVVLFSFTNLKKLTLGIDSFPPELLDLDILDKLEYLDITIDEQLSSIPKLPESLKWFRVKHYSGSGQYRGIRLSLNGLSECVNLETFIIAIPGVKINLEDISECKAIKNLSIGTDTDNLNVVENLPLLTNLSLYPRNMDLDIKLSRCKLLEFVYINYDDMEDLNFLSNCKKLTTLYVESKELEDISALATCKELVNLELRSDNLEDYSALEDLEELGEGGGREPKYGEIISFLDKAEYHNSMMETPD